MNQQALPAMASFAEFARLANVKRSYVTALKSAGRLVLSEDGKTVRVAESLERIAATRDPSRAAVVERHAMARGLAASAETGSAAPEAGDGAGEEGEAPEEAQPPYYAEAKARREHWMALAAERDYRVSMRELLVAAEVEGAVANAVTHLRTRLESLAEMLAPQLAAETDEARCRALVAEQVEHALQELARQFRRLAAEGGSE